MPVECCDFGKKTVEASPYLLLAEELAESEHALAAYYCRVFGAGLLLRALKRHWTPEAEQRLSGVLAQAELAQQEMPLRQGRKRLEAFVLISLREAGGLALAHGPIESDLPTAFSFRGRFRDALLLLDVLEWMHDGDLPRDWALVAGHARRLSTAMQGTMPKTGVVGEDPETCADSDQRRAKG